MMRKWCLFALVALACGLAPVAAAKSAVTYSLIATSPGVSIDAKTGVVTIDPKAASDGAAKALAATMYPARRFKKDGDQDAIKHYSDDTRDFFKTLTGKTPAGLPVLVDTGVTATDADGQSATLKRYVLLDVPTTAVTADIKALADAAQQPPAAPKPRPAGGGRGRG
jgi:hypothetical protein